MNQELFCLAANLSLGKIEGSSWAIFEGGSIYHDGHFRHVYSKYSDALSNFRTLVLNRVVKAVEPHNKASP